MKRNAHVEIEKGMKQFCKIGGGSLRLADGRRIKPNQLFWEHPEVLSKSALMAVKEVQGNDIPKQKQDKPKDVNSFKYSTKETDEGFVVIDENEKVLSEPASAEQAEEWAFLLSSGKKVKDLNLHPQEQDTGDTVIEFHKEQVSPGWFVVKNTAGTQVSEGKMHSKNADAYIAELLEE